MDPRFILAQVYADDHGPNGAGALVRLTNAGSTPQQLSGWVLEWGTAQLAFSGSRMLNPGDQVTVAWDEQAYEREWGRKPDYAVHAAGSGTPILAAVGVPEPLRSAQGQVRLRTPTNAVADALLWGNLPAVEGWQGPTVTPLGAGALFTRAIDEATLGADSPGRCVSETGKREVWWQGTDWMSRRMARAGQVPMPYPGFTAASALAFATPDSAFATIAAFIDGAMTTLDINLYLFTQTDLAPYLHKALARKVAVRLLIEGEPVTGVPAEYWQALDDLQKAGVQLRRLVAAPDGFKRYHYDHAKYAVADGRHALVMSDNWTHHSVPATPKATQRGWGIILDSPELAAYLTAIFTEDFNPAAPDSLPFDAAARPTGQFGPDELAPDAPAADLATPYPSGRFDSPVSLRPAQAPEYALLTSCGATGVMRAAAQTLDVQQLSIPLWWGKAHGGSPESTPNLFLSEVIAAARRGVKVRVQLDGTYRNANDPRANSQTCDYLNQLAAKEHLTLEARLLHTGMAIHNKGVIADGKTVLVSSVNWSENSPLFNREMGLVVEHPGVAGYFTTLFERDWQL